MDQSPLVPPAQEAQPPESQQNTIGNLQNNVEDAGAPALLQVETTHIDPGVSSNCTQQNGDQSFNNKPGPEPINEVSSQEVKPTEPNQTSDKVTVPNSQPEDTEQDLCNVDVGELTAQIMEMISQEDPVGDLTQTILLKKNVELQEFMVKLIELLREKTNLSANLERQNTALTNQARSLRDVISITKDLLNIRNMEVEHLHVDMNAMEKCIKEERERHNLAVQRLSEAMTLNDKLKTEYLNQMELFGKLRDKYNEKVALLYKENQNLKDRLKERNTTIEPTVSASQDVIVEATTVATHEGNEVV